MSIHVYTIRAGHSSPLHRIMTLLVCWALLATILSSKHRPFGALGLPRDTQKTLSLATRRKRSRRQLPADASASYARYSSELQDENSIEQQRQRCRDFAVREGQPITSEFEFADEAISGTQLHREGLDALLRAAEAGRFNRLYFYSLSRLARESVIGMPILKRLVYVYRIRVISVTEGLDSSREGWETLAQILLMQHERYIKELSASVFRGQEGNARNQTARFSNGDYCFGYTGVPVPGSEQTRRGRHAKPRMTYQIDPVTCEWVRRIFDWFVRERRSLRWITRELNRLGAPKDHRSWKKDWHHAYLPRLLGNSKYVGIWPWGQMKNTRDPETGDVIQEPRLPAETDPWIRHFPELRIIDDETFLAARQLLADNAARHAHSHRENGEFGHDQQGGAAASPRHLLSGLIVCKNCGSTFYVGGAHGKYLFCPSYSRGTCACQTALRRDLAERLILEVVSTRLLANPVWLQTLFEGTMSAWHRLQSTLPNDLRDSEAALAEVNRKIGRLVDQVEQHNQPDPDLQARLATRRGERRQLEDKLIGLRRQAEQRPSEPTMEWVQAQLGQLQEVLTAATPAAAFALRDLLGGQVVVEEVRTEGRKRYYLRGTFQIKMGQVLNGLGIADDSLAAPNDPLNETITIDFVGPNPLDVKAEEAKALRDTGISQQQIAQQMNCWPSQVTKLLKHWTKMHGQPLPPKPQNQNRPLDKFQQIADEVVRRMHEDELLHEIAQALDVDRNTVTAAIRWWHEQRGLPVPDGRARRKGLNRKVSRPPRREDDPPANDAPTS